MGANLKILTLYDALHHGFQLRITCGNRKCGRSGIYATQNILDWFRPGRGRGRGRNPTLEVAGSYFRCEECGHRGAILGLVAPHLAPDLEPLKPSAYEQKLPHWKRWGKARGE